MKNINLITLGCSWTAQFDESVLPWPDVIGNEKNWEVTNYGQKGGGNKFALDQFILHILYGRKVDKAYWLLTEWDRYDTIFPNKPWPETLHPFQSSVRPAGYRNRALEKFKTVRTDYTDQAFKNFTDWTDRKIEIGSILLDCIDMKDMVNTNLYYIVIFQKLCKARGIDFKIIQGLRPINCPDRLLDLHKYILKSNLNSKLVPYIGYPFSNIERSSQWTQDK